MTDLKYNLLKMLYNASPRCPLKMTDLLSTGYAEPINIDAAIEDLLELKYIKNDRCSNCIRIASPGRIAYESEKELRDQQSKHQAEKQADQLAMMSLGEIQRKKQFRHDFVIAAFSAVLGAGVMYLLEHFPQLVNAIISLFK